MTKSDYQHALRILDTTLDLLGPRAERPIVRRRRLRALTVEFALLRVRLSQPAARLRRN
jgi:hypothetical protein